MSKVHNKPRILLAPLDWGLGHATRCIPIIYELLRQGATVIIAGNEAQQKLLAKEFPDCEMINLQGYNVVYGNSKFFLFFKLLSQLPNILKTKKQENEWLQKIIIDHHIDGIISDNRYGLYTTLRPAVFITHQLLIKNPWGRILESKMQKINYEFISKFSACWVPDVETFPGLAGALSHPKKLPPVPVKYIGPLSRMKEMDNETGNKILIIISGPEPQRTLFEKIILQQITGYHSQVVLVRGLPNEKTILHIHNTRVQVFNHLSADDLRKEMEQAAYIICRSGYSSVMDIMAARKKAIFIPTPGQSEQQYLAKICMQQGFAIACNQKNFDLQVMLKQATSFRYHFANYTAKDSLQTTVTDFLYTCKKPGAG